jgi:outer membrane receptor protein involved in Fe transport
LNFHLFSGTVPAAVVLALVLVPAHAEPLSQGTPGVGASLPLLADAANAPALTTTDSSAGRRTPPSATLDKVTVTAQKRSEDIKEVPISISVMSGDEMAAQRISNYDDISRAVPGVSFNSVNASSGQTNITIRGVSSTAGSATVGTYLDDVSITVKNFYDRGSPLPRMYDLDRIEVLRGPQGTLWGASSEGGTIRYIAKAPDLQHFSGEVSGDVSATQHGGANFLTSAVINTPIQPGVFALRTSIGYAQDSGYIDHYTPAGQKDRNGVNGEETFTLHVQGKLLAGDGLSVAPALFYQRDRIHDNSAFYPALGKWNQAKRVDEYGEDSVFLASLNVTKALGFADLSSVTGAYMRRTDREQDGTYYNSTIFATAILDPVYLGQSPPITQFQAATDSILANLVSPVAFKTQTQQFSQEFRLSSNAADRGSNPWQWVAGLYYANQKIHNTNFQRIQGINTTFQQIYGVTLENSLLSAGPDVPLFPGDVDEADDRTYNEKQYAVFGQLDYDFAPGWHAGLGLRYVTANLDFASQEYGFFQLGNLGTTSPYVQAATFHAVTPKFTVSHDLSPEDKVYASASKGFRLGGPTGPIVFGPGTVCAGDLAARNVTTQPTRYDSDSLWTYELGSKNALFDNRASLDIAAFYTQWRNIQQEIYLPTCGYYFITNAGDAKIFGGEVEAYLKPISGLKIGVTAAVNHATISRTNNNAIVPEGAHLIDVPEFTWTGSVSYSRPWDDEYILTARANFAWTGHSYGDYQSTSPNYDNPSYGVLNLSLGLAGSVYDLEFYAKNALADKTVIQSPQINTVIEGYTVRPRTIGFTARARF